MIARRRPDKDVTDAVVRKNNQEIGHRIKSGHLSLLGRKILNVLIWYAQEMRHKEDEGGRWKLPVSRLIKDTRFASRDYDLLRSALDELQEVRIIRPAKGGGVTSEVMIPSYTLDNVVHDGNEMLPRGQKKRGGELMLWFMLPPELKRQLLDPEQYTRLPIGIMASLKTTPGLVLYEICRRYVTNPSKVTNRDSWQNWWRVLTGATPEAEPPAFKYAKRDVFKKGLEEVNRLTDIDVEMIEFKAGKFVRELQFSVNAKMQTGLDLGPPPVDAGLLARITAINIPLGEAEKLVARYPEDEIEATLTFVEARVGNRSLVPVDSPAAYFKKALSEQYAKATKPAASKPPITLPAPQPALVRNPELAARRQAILREFDEKSPTEKEEILRRFAAENPAIAARVRGNPGSRFVREALVSWIGGKDSAS